MLNIDAEAAALRRIESPIDRQSAALMLAEKARELEAEANLVRAEAIKEIYDVFGGTKTSRLLGINRVSLYRLIEPVRTEAERAARSAKWVLAGEVLLRVAAASAGSVGQGEGNPDGQTA